MEEDVTMVTCTQVPPAIANGPGKRTRRPEHWSAAAHGLVSTLTTPRKSTSRMRAMANNGGADMTQQTPMPQIDPANDYGPPPPLTSPTPLRQNSAAYGEFIASFCTRMGMWPELCPDFTYIVQGCSGLLPGDDQRRRRGSWRGPSPGSPVHGSQPQSCQT